MDDYRRMREANELLRERYVEAQKRITKTQKKAPKRKGKKR